MPYVTYNCDALTGGAARALDAIAVASLADGERAICLVSGEILFFRFNASGIDAENIATHPFRVRPDDYGAGPGVWEEQEVNEVFMTPDLGTPSAGNLGNCTALPQAAVIGLTVTSGPTFDHIHLTSGQVGFPATAVPSADPNTLDDYEEGTFNVTFAAGSGTITIDSTQDTMSYTKIGRLVSVQGLIRVSSVSTPSGALSILGLPFAVGDFSEFAERAACAFFVGNLTGTINMIQGIVAAGGTTIYVSEFNGTTDVDMADHIQASSYFYISLVYYT